MIFSGWRSASKNASPKFHSETDVVPMINKVFGTPMNVAVSTVLKVSLTLFE